MADDTARVQATDRVFTHEGTDYPPGEPFEARASLLDEWPRTLERAEAEICGTEKSDGSICQRDTGDCPYHGE